MRLARILISLCPLALPSLAGSITLTINYSPSVGTTPTLTQTMLIALALLLPVMAFRAIRKFHFDGTSAAPAELKIPPAGRCPFLWVAVLITRFQIPQEFLRPSARFR